MPDAPEHRGPFDPAEPMPMRPLRPPDEEKRLAWKATFAGWATLLVLGTLLVATLTTTLVMVVTIRDSQKDGRALVQQIKSCTTPGRACAKRATRQTAKAVAAINTSTLFTVTCGARRPNQSVAEIRECVARLTEALRDANPPKSRRTHAR